LTPDPSSGLIAIDAGTTRMRAWLVDGERITRRREAFAGARDSATSGSAGRLRAAVRDLVTGLLEDAGGGVAPPRIAAAGMITSPEGLVEVPHVLAPAGLAELAAAAEERRLPEVSDLPFVFVPGVRTAGLPGASGIGATDVMRGEETLALGLLRQRLLAAGGALFNVGSHWKLVRIDAAGRIAWSVTSLAGEMVHAVRTDTILASAVPDGPVPELDVARVQDGMAEARRSGLARALFCVRLLQIADSARPEGRLSFLLGAFVGADLDRLEANGFLTAGEPLVVSGDEKVGGVWTVAMQSRGYPVRRLSADEVESAFVAGVSAILDARDQRDRDDRGGW
jgi:2-dehydro-3-deoxygalactonokinase